MKIFRCSVYKIRGAQPPAATTHVGLENGCTFVVSSNLNHISVDYFRSSILAEMLLSSAFQQAQGVHDSAELDGRATAHRDKIISDEVSGCYLTVFIEREEDEPIAEPNRKIGPYLVAILNPSPATPSSTFHKTSINAAISAFAISTKNIDRAEKIFEANYRVHTDHAYVHYYSMSGYGEARVISQLPAEFSQDFRVFSERLVDDPHLISVFRLLASSYTQHSDKLASFLAAWSAFEIFVGKSFKSQEKSFFTSFESVHADFVTRIREVMSDKYRLTDKFALLSSTLAPDTAIADIKAFKDFKRVRDELLHGGDIDIRRLPLEAIQTLLRRYLVAFINKVQT